ncbi:LLM class flavin-dependent oxidoreductase [Micromonospora inositola]|uniref:LLM class flavin-dependent oxidoreductase n=1 Tax=Micromonospora inositola TaxID=47865 RepID=UPI000B5ACA14|nr:LLM class flavin-dependent oxidoreductase [Micromonospora inositola]
MRHGLEISCGGPSMTASLLVELGELAERAGWDGVFFEGLDVLVGLLGGDRVQHRGVHYRADGVALRPAPVQTPRVPVWVGGSTQAEAVLRRAARADGIVPYKLTDTDGWSDFTPEEVHDLVAALPATRADGQPFDVAVGGRRRRPDERAERAYVAELAAAGATWWLEFIKAGDPRTAALTGQARRLPGRSRAS